MAALFTMTSRRPWRVTVVPISASTSSQIPTSVSWKLAAPPVREMSSSVGSPPSRGFSVTSAKMTVAPSPAKPIAIARPMPELAPVTTAIFPASRLDMASVSTLRIPARIIEATGLEDLLLKNMPTSGAIPPDIELAASLFEALSSRTRRGRGIVRDSYGAGEQAAHDIVRSAATAMDLEVSIDAIGNLLMTLPGRDRQTPHIVIGSHLDSVPQGGNFDGAAGVVAGMAALSAMHGAGFVPSCDVTVMAIRAEESAWFDVPYLGSAGAFGLLEPSCLSTPRSDNGQSLEATMRQQGFDP